MRPFLIWLSRALIVWCLVFSSQDVKAQSFTFKPYDAVEDDDLNEVEISKFFNMARCLCDADSTDGSYSFRLGISSFGPYEDQEVYFLLGDYCDEEVSRPDCYEFDSINYSNFNKQQDILIPVNRVVDPETGACTEARDTSTFHLFMTAEKNSTVASYPIDFDTKPPGVPTITSVKGGEAAVIVYWERPENDDEDIDFYNVLCEMGGAAPDVSSASKAEWTTTLEVCGKDITPDDVVIDVDAGVEDAGVEDAGLEDAGVSDAATPDAEILDAEVVDAALPDAEMDAGEGVDGSTATSCFGTLQEGDYPRACFVCGSVGPTVRDLRINGLPNGVEVNVAVVAVDETRNVSYLSNVETATPMPTTDFAEHYSESGGSGEGGFCFVATVAYGSYNHSHVRVLRRFRDKILLNSSWGRSFVAWYYKNGRRLARPFEKSQLARGVLRLALLPCVAVAYLWVHLGGFALLFLMGLCVTAGVLWLKKRWKTQGNTEEVSPRDPSGTGEPREKMGVQK